MGLINIYSRSPISHKFMVIDDHGEQEHIIFGTNTFGIQIIDKKIPKVTLMEEEVFNKIKAKYISHVKLFGGKTLDGIPHEALIYTAKTEKDAIKIMEDAKPVITDNEIATKTKNVKQMKEAP